MQTLGLDEESTEKKADPTEPQKGFWKRQFQREGTGAQKVFDWAFGVVIPLICMMADPMIFKGAGLNHGIPTLGFAKPFAYLLSFGSIFMMSGWLILGKRLGRFGGPIAGLFIAGSVVSLIVGVAILPLSIIGMFFLIGFLGYTPLLSALVYFRNGLRAYRAAGGFLEKRALLGAALLSGAFSLVIPYVINREIAQCLDEMATGNVPKIYSNAEKIKYLAPIIDFHAFAGKYCGETPESAEHKALADIYFRFTGDDIENIDDPVCYDT